MPDFRSQDRFARGPRKPFNNKGPRRDFGGDREMFDAECSNCHKMTQVPFRPNGKKPVFCRDCFVPEGGERGGDRPPHGRFEKRDFGPKRDFAPRVERDTRIDDLARELSSMKAMLERIASVLEKSERATALSATMEQYREEAPKAKKAPAKKAKASKKA